MEIELKYNGNTIEINRASSVKYTKFVFQPISRSEALCIYSISNKLVYEKHSGNRIEINRACLRKAIAVRLRCLLSVQGLVFHSFFQGKLLLEHIQSVFWSEAETRLGF